MIVNSFFHFIVGVCELWYYSCMNKYPAFELSSAEYAKIVNEISTNYGKYKNKRFAIHMSYGIDNRPYWYYFENHGFNNYNIYQRIEVS